MNLKPSLWPGTVGTRLQATGAALACLLAGPVAADELKVGRTLLRTDASVQIESITLPAEEVRGERHAVYQRRLVRLNQGATQAASYLVIEELGSQGGIFEWTGICSGVKPSANLFVHNPLRRLNDHCVLAFESSDLGESLAVLDKVAAEHAQQRDWKLDTEGYVVRATYTLTSGAIMTVLAVVPKPFAGLPVTGPLPLSGTELPEGVRAWALQLGEEVKTSVSSLSGKWQLPPIKQQ